MRGTIAFVLKGYPRLSETFIAQEIRGLEQAGLAISIIALRHPTDPHRHPILQEIQAPVSYLPEYLWRHPLRLWRGWRRARRMAGYQAARQVWFDDLRRDRSANRVRRFGQALVLAAELDPAIDRLHAHFLHTPSSVTRYAALITGLPWSCSAHAKDIWTSPEWEKREKLASCHWAVTCAAASYNHLDALAPRGRIELVYHGLDFSRFPACPPATEGPPRDGSDSDKPVTILAVGRAVEKKGFDDLLAALATLPDDLHWRLIHIGGGEKRQALADQARDAGLDDRIDWRGAQPQDVVLGAYRDADLFVLPSRITRDGDRDGLPNVLMEAMSQGLCVVSTRVSGIPELIDDGETGRLVDGGDRPALSNVLATLITDPTQRDRLGRAGNVRVRRDFAMDRGLARLAAKFGLTG
ncbi:MAG: glycosyltransferase family 4 protein [Alphaproteobacteria bacterium]